MGKIYNIKLVLQMKKSTISCTFCVFADISHRLLNYMLHF